MERRFFLRLSVLGAGLTLFDPFEVFSNSSPIQQVGKAGLGNSEVIALMTKAREEFYRSNFAVAKTIYEGIISKTPAYLPAYDRLRAVLNASHSFQESLVLINAGVSNNADNAYFLIRQAKAYRILALNSNPENGNEMELFLKSVESSCSSFSKEASIPTGGLQKTINSIEKRNKHYRNKNERKAVKLPTDVSKKIDKLVDSSKKDSVTVTPLSFSEQLKRIENRKRVDLFNSEKEKRRANDILRSKKNLYRKQIATERDKQTKQQLAFSLFSMDESDCYSYFLVRRHAKSNKDHKALHSVSQQHVKNNPSDNWAKVGYCKDLFFCFDQSQDKKYLQFAQEALDSVAHDRVMENEKLKVAVSAAQSTIYFLRTKYKDASSYLLTVLKQSVKEEVYLRTHLLIAYSKTLEKTKSSTVARNTLNLICNPKSDDPSHKGLLEYLPSTAGSEVKENIPAYLSLVKLSEKMHDLITVKSLCETIVRLDKNNSFAVNRLKDL